MVIKMRSIAFSNIDMEGDLAVRSGRNFARLEGQWYRPEEVFKADSHGWPGDWEGRILLALTLLEQSTHRTSAYLGEIMSLVPAHLNERGYFGPVLPQGIFDEQHFGGHSWMLRALTEYYRYKKDPAALSLLETMVRNFLLPAKGSFAHYPIDPGTRFSRQEVWILSKLQTKTKHHAETSDAGCVFIMLDGATAAYEVLRWPELREVIEEMADRFMEMDLETLHIQTHATLSAVRGILRFYELTGQEEYLTMAIQRYELYRKAAWTEAYGNYNWFGAPRWTEPCAIIDSFMVSVMLWAKTGIPSYLNDAHLIYYNALSHGNRINGSFGTDRCCGAHEAEENLFLSPVNYETYWCCTMRGGEGFSSAITYHYFTEENTVYVPFYNPCVARIPLRDGRITIKEETKYPFDGWVRFSVIESALADPITVRLFVPQWSGSISFHLNGESIPSKAEKGFLTVKGVFLPGDVLELNLDLGIYARETAFENSIKGYHKFFYGPMLLGRKAKTETDSLDGNRFENYAESRYKSSDIIRLPEDTQFERLSEHEFRVKGSDIVLSALCSVRDMTEEDTMRQMLFTDDF